MKKIVSTSALILAALSPAAVSAQTSWTAPGNSWLPYTNSGYVGLHVLRPSFNRDCITGFDCDDHATGGKIYTGGLINQMFGLEVGYLRTGYGQRGASRYRAQGLNLSLVGNIPVAPIAGIFGKVGTTYGYTDTEAQVIGAADGTDRAWGLSYGLGANIEVARGWAVVAEWERHNFRFVDGSDKLSMWSLGARYKF